MIVPR